MVRTFRPVAILMMALVLEMSIAEFLSVQQLSDRRRRARFALAHTCKPAITATRAFRDRVKVLVTCLQPEPDAPRWDPPSRASEPR
jgi:hypothetical protein